MKAQCLQEEPTPFLLFKDPALDCILAYAKHELSKLIEAEN